MRAAEWVDGARCGRGRRARGLSTSFRTSRHPLPTSGHPAPQRRRVASDGDMLSPSSTSHVSSPTTKRIPSMNIWKASTLGLAAALTIVIGKDGLTSAAAASGGTDRPSAIAFDWGVEQPHMQKALDDLHAARHSLELAVRAPPRLACRRARAHRRGHQGHGRRHGLGQDASPRLKAARTRGVAGGNIDRRRWAPGLDVSQNGRSPFWGSSRRSVVRGPAAPCRWPARGIPRQFASWGYAGSASRSTTATPRTAASTSPSR